MPPAFTDALLEPAVTAHVEPIRQLREQVRQVEGRTADPTAALPDSQAVRAAETVPRTSRGFDAGSLRTVFPTVRLVWADSGDAGKLVDGVGSGTGLAVTGPPYQHLLVAGLSLLALGLAIDVAGRHSPASGRVLTASHATAASTVE